MPPNTAPAPSSTGFDGEQDGGGRGQELAHHPEHHHAALRARGCPVRPVVKAPCRLRFLLVERLRLPQLGDVDAVGPVRGPEPACRGPRPGAARRPRLGWRRRPSSMATNAAVTSSATSVCRSRAISSHSSPLVSSSIRSSMSREIVRIAPAEAVGDLGGQVGDAVADDRRSTGRPGRGGARGAPWPLLELGEAGLHRLGIGEQPLLLGRARRARRRRWRARRRPTARPRLAFAGSTTSRRAP